VSPRQALKLSVYFGERSRAHGRLVSDELLDLYERRGLRLSIVLRGAQGFGAKHRLRTDRLLTLSEDLPVVAVAVDEREQQIQALASEAAELAHSGLITLERADLLADSAYAGADDGQETLKLSVYVGRHERMNGKPAFAAVCQLLYERGVSGATVLLGVDGTRRGRRERARFFARNGRVPAMILAVGESGCVLAGAEELARMLPDALLTVERVRVCKRDGRLLQAPHAAAECGDASPQPLQKLTIVTSEATMHEGRRPLHTELIMRLRATQLAGATSLRGIWGFHGDHAPHGDKLLSLRRHVPIVTTVIDAPEQIARAFALVDDLTQERGLVTSELLPANMASSCGCSSVG
jgi:PII-like signaling protein